MLFNSIEYLFLFVPIVFVIYFLLSKFKLYKISKLFLVLASLYFYGSYKLDYVEIIICSILFNYSISFLFKLNIEKKYKKSILILGIFINIIMLVFFKYFNFLVDTLSKKQISPLNTWEIVMPLGISFFTIQQISYIIDCYKEDVKEYNLLDYSLFVCFFPQLIAGPIVRHQEIIPQFQDINNKKVNQDNIFAGIFIITIGLLKKTVFADSYVNFINCINNREVYNDTCISWVLSLVTVLQGYFDFSGYCDMAIGSALLFNINLPWNFNSPFKAVSITDFWKRWNITLMKFLYDYIYMPLERYSKNLFDTCRNIMIVFFVLGCWYGSNPVYVFYGILNGILVCLNKIWSKFNIKIPKFISILITFITVIILSPFIQTKIFSNTFAILKSMFSINSHIYNAYIENSNLIFMLPPPHEAKLNIYILILSIIIIFFSKNSTELTKIYVKSNNIYFTVILAIIFVYAVLSITKSSEFIYFVF